MEFIYKNVKYSGLKMVMEPMADAFDEKTKRTKRSIGRYIQFVDGTYRTDKKDEIEFIDEYMKNNQNEIVKIDVDKMKRRITIQKEVEVRLEKEETEKEKKLNKQIAKADKDSQKIAKEKEIEDKLINKHVDDIVNGKNVIEEIPEDPKDSDPPKDPETSEVPEDPKDSDSPKDEIPDYKG